jgi:hypothetical protein
MQIAATRDVSAKKSGDRRRKDICNRAIDWHNSEPEPLASLRGKRRCVEDVDEQVMVDNLNADVSIQASCDQSR